MTKSNRFQFCVLGASVTLVAGSAYGGSEEAVQLRFTPDFGDVTHLGVLSTEDGATASDAPAIPPADDGWTLELAPFVWMPSLDADVFVKDAVFDVDMSFSDIFDDLKFAAMVQVRAVRDKWVLEMNGMYIRLSTDADFGNERDVQRRFAFAGDIAEQVLRRVIEIPVGIDVAVGIGADDFADISVELDLAIVELFAGYELCSFPIGNLSNPHTQRDASIKITPYGGGRLNYLDVETNVWLSASADVSVKVDVELGPDNVDQSVAAGRSGSAKFELDKNKFWVDPVIGLHVALANLDRWDIAVRSDIGGFGIGSASDLVWSLGGIATYHVNPRFRVWGGYYLLDYDYGGRTLGLDGRFEGPVIGGSFTF